MLISKDIYSKILNGKIDEIENATGLLEEFITNSKVKHLVPSIIVLYHRTAFTYPISDVRITFDSNIQSGLYSYDLFNKDVPIVRAEDFKVLTAIFLAVLKKPLLTFDVVTVILSI